MSRRMVAPLFVGLVAIAGGCTPPTGSHSTTTTTSSTTTTSTTTSTTTTSTTTTIDPTSDGTVSSGFQLNAAQSGGVTAPAITVATLTKKWSATFAGQPSYAAIDAGVVLVTAKTSYLGGYGTTLYALSATDGHVLWSSALGGTYWWSSVATAGGVAYALNYSGALRAFDLTTGTLLWQQQLAQSQYNAPVVVRDHVVYASGSGSGGTLYALNASTGAIKWSVPVGNGDIDAPSVDATGVYTSHVCDTEGTSLAGVHLWSTPSSCTGGGAKNATLDSANHRLYVRNYEASPAQSFIVDTRTGAVGVTIPYGSPYAISSGYAYTVANGVLVKVDPTTGQQVWSMGGDINDTLVGAPVVVNGTVIVGGSSGKVYGIAASGGERVVTLNAGAPIAQLDEQNVSQPTAGTAVGQGLVTVTTTNGIVAFGN